MKGPRRGSISASQVYFACAIYRRLETVNVIKRGNKLSLSGSAGHGGVSRGLQAPLGLLERIELTPIGTAGVADAIWEITRADRQETAVCRKGSRSN